MGLGCRYVRSSTITYCRAALRFVFVKLSTLASSSNAESAAWRVSSVVLVWRTTFHSCGVTEASNVIAGSPFDAQEQPSGPPCREIDIQNRANQPDNHPR